MECYALIMKDLLMDNLKAIKELVDTVDIFDTSNIDDIIDKINTVGCTSFMFIKSEIEQMCKDGDINRVEDY